MHAGRRTRKLVPMSLTLPSWLVGIQPVGTVQQPEDPLGWRTGGERKERPAIVDACGKWRATCDMSCSCSHTKSAVTF